MTSPSLRYDAPHPKPNFRELRKTEVQLRRIPIPRTRLNRPLLGARTAGRPDAANRPGLPTDLPVVGPRHGKIASAVYRDRERVGELAHEGAVGGEVTPRQIAQAPIRSFYQ